MKHKILVGHSSKNCIGRSVIHKEPLNWSGIDVMPAKTSSTFKYKLTNLEYSVYN